MALITQSGEWLLKNGTIFSTVRLIFHKIRVCHIVQSACVYQVRVSKGPHDLCLELSLVELYKTHGKPLKKMH